MLSPIPRILSIQYMLDTILILIIVYFLEGTANRVQLVYSNSKRDARANDSTGTARRQFPTESLAIALLPDSQAV